MALGARRAVCVRRFGAFLLFLAGVLPGDNFVFQLLVFKFIWFRRCIQIYFVEKTLIRLLNYLITIYITQILQTVLCILSNI